MDPLDALRAETARYGYGLRIGMPCAVDGEVHFVAPEGSLLAIGPPRSGKTSALVVPNLLAACGPAITTSTKPDVVLATAAARRRVGRCYLFDPSGRTTGIEGVEPISWSPLASSLDWDGANLMAQAMVRTARPNSDRGDAAHWTERAQSLLGPAFHAAAIEQMGMDALLRTIDRREGDVIQATLARHNHDIPLDTFAGVLATEERERSGIWSTASSVLAAYRSEGALESTRGRGLDFGEFVRSGDTLYICSGSDEQRQAAPIVGGLLRDAKVAGYDAAAAGDLGAACEKPPLLLLLDEVANIAPLHDFPALVSEGGSQGVVTLACLQDLSQAVERWGRLGGGLFSMCNTKAIFPGVGDTRTLEAISELGGDHDVPTVSVSEGPRLPGLPGLFGRRAPGSEVVSSRRQRRVPVDEIARGRPGHVVCIDGATVSFVEARPWFEVERVHAAVESPARHAGRATSRSSGRTF